MNEPQDRKTEAPSRRRLDEARREGQVFRSRDLSGVAVLAAVLGGVWSARGWIGDKLSELARFALTAPTWLRDLPDQTGVVAQMAYTEFATTLLAVSAIPLGLAILTAVLVNVVQVQGLFAPGALTPKFERLNPVEGAKQLFSLRNLVELLKSIVKLAVIGGALYLVVIAALPTLVRVPNLSVSGVAAAAGEVFVRFFGAALAAFALIAIFDLWFQRVNFLRRMRMTKEEVKRERRDEEGDPHMVGHRRALIREAAFKSPLERAAKASVVVVGSADSVAIALFVDANTAQRPWVLHKGRAHVGAAIVAIAREKAIRIIDDSSLAEKIYREVGVDADVSPALARDIRRLFL